MTLGTLHKSSRISPKMITSPLFKKESWLFLPNSKNTIIIALRSLKPWGHHFNIQNLTWASEVWLPATASSITNLSLLCFTSCLSSRSMVSTPVSSHFHPLTKSKYQIYLAILLHLGEAHLKFSKAAFSHLNKSICFNWIYQNLIKTSTIHLSATIIPG